MGTILRNVGAVVTGFIAASVVMMIVEAVNGHVLYPDLAKSAQRVTNREEMRELMAAVPVGALLVVIGGWSLGSVVGGWVAGRLARGAPLRRGIALGVLLTLAGVANHLMMPPPVWFLVTSLPVLPLGACFGASRAIRREPPAPAPVET